MAQKYTTHVIRGTLNWVKVLGAPRMNEFAKEKQWSVDVTPDDNGMKEVKRIKLDSKLRDKSDDRKKFLSFRQSEFKKDGSLNEAIQVTDIQGNPWPQNVLIGNGSIGDVKFSFCDFGTTKGNYIKAIRILKHVPYVAQEFAPLSEDDEFFATPVTGDNDAAPEGKGEADTPSEAQDNPDDLDDDVPFNSGN